MARRNTQALLLALPPLAWFTSQQASSFLLHVRCGGLQETRWQGSLALLVIFGLALIGPLIALRVRSSSRSPWLVYGAFFWAGIFTLAILFQTMAALLLPTCVS